mmetsp:Transcript_21775/g.42301  ORF Transcript_21775/g.42301 Transcript_21775/m.42301 type:complete len:94 (-) Transcript_21775:118-399(-)
MQLVIARNHAACRRRTSSYRALRASSIISKMTSVSTVVAMVALLSLLSDASPSPSLSSLSCRLFLLSIRAMSSSIVPSTCATYTVTGRCCPPR